MAGTNQLPFASNCVYASAHKSIDAHRSFDLSKNRLYSLAPQLILRFSPFGFESSSHALTGTRIRRDSPMRMLLIQTLFALLRIFLDGDQELRASSFNTFDGQVIPPVPCISRASVNAFLDSRSIKALFGFMDHRLKLGEIVFFLCNIGPHNDLFLGNNRLSIVALDIPLSCLHDPAVRVCGVGFSVPLDAIFRFFGLRSGFFPACLLLLFLTVTELLFLLLTLRV